MRTGPVTAICALAFVSVSVLGAMPRLEFVSPRGGEIYLDGQTQAVRLNTRCKNVTVELSRDGGQTYTTLGTIDNTVADVSARNTLSWKVAAPYSGNCVIRAKTRTLNKDYVVTSGAFSISAASGVGVTTTATTTVGVAALAPNSVTTDALADGSVTNPKLAEGAVTYNKVSSGAASNSTVLTSDGGGGANWQPVASSSISDGSITTAKLADGSVTTPKLADAAVTTAKIADGNVTDAKIAAVAGAKVTGTVADATTAVNFSGALSGDVTGTQGATVVSQVGGVTAANVASGANLANAATNLNTASTIVRRDASGNFSAGTIAATAIGLGGVTTPRAGLEIGGTQGLLSAGPAGAGTPLNLGVGVRMHWYPRKAAFRAGVTDGAWWDDANIGFYSVALGYAPRANGFQSVALGAYAFAGGDAAVSISTGWPVQPTIASGRFSLAMGTGADTNGKDGAAVICDGDGISRASAGNQLTMRYAGGYRLASSSPAFENADGTGNPSSGVYMNGGVSGWTNYSSRDKKENFRLLDGEDVLWKIRNLSITEWNYKGLPQSRYIGPVAEEFWDAFRLCGDDNKGINTICIDGVNMAGVQALEKRTSLQQAKIDALSAENTALKTKLADLEARLAKVEK